MDLFTEELRLLPCKVGTLQRITTAEEFSGEAQVVHGSHKQEDKQEYRVLGKHRMALSMRSHNFQVTCIK